MKLVAFQTAGVILAFFAAIALVVLTAERIHLTLGDPSGARLTRATLVITIGAALVLTGLFSMLVFAGLCDRGAGRSVSQVFWPMLAVKAMLMGLFCILSIRAMDSLVHGLRPQWVALREPEVSLFFTVLYLGLALSLGWLTWVLWRGRAATQAATVGLCEGFSIGLAALVVIAVAARG